MVLMADSYSNGFESKFRYMDLCNQTGMKVLAGIPDSYDRKWWAFRIFSLCESVTIYWY